MADYQYISSEDGYFDVLADASFEKTLTPQNINDVLQVILEVVNSKPTLGTFFDGIAYLEIDLQSFKLKFRFSEQKVDIDNLDEVERDDLPRKTSQFMMHLFAKIDNVCKLKDVPFTINFRAFINLYS